MKRILIFGGVVLLLGCARSPLQLDRETRPGRGFTTTFVRNNVAQSTLATDGTALFFGTRKGELVSLDAASGKKNWEVKLDAPIDVAPFAQNDAVYVGTAAGSFYRLNVKDGQQKWKYEVPGEILNQATVLGNKYVIFSSNDGMLYALDTNSGQPLWTYRRGLPDRMTIHSLAAASADPSAVYAGFSDGAVVALRDTDGTELWKQDLRSSAKFPDLVASLLSMDKQLIAAQFSGALYALDRTGKIRWSLDNGGGASAAIAFGDKLIVPASEHRLIALSSSTGDKVWTYQTPEAVLWSGLTVFGDKLLAGSFEGWLFVLQASDGKFLWKYDVGGAVMGPPIVHGDRAWVLTRKGALLGFSLRG